MPPKPPAAPSAAPVAPPQKGAPPPAAAACRRPASATAIERADSGRAARPNGTPAAILRAGRGYAPAARRKAVAASGTHRTASGWTGADRHSDSGVDQRQPQPRFRVDRRQPQLRLRVDLRRLRLREHPSLRGRRPLRLLRWQIGGIAAGRTDRPSAAADGCSADSCRAATCKSRRPEGYSAGHAGPAGRPHQLEGFRGERRETQQGGRTVITEPGRIIVRDPSGRSFIRHNEVDRFRYGARDIRTEQRGNETRTIIPAIRPDGTQIITVNDRSGQLLRRIRRDQRGREIIIIDSYRGPRGFGGFYVDLAPPILRIPHNRYIVEADEASPESLYETMMAPPVERLERRYSLDEIRYSPSVRQRMPSIDLNSINFETGSWEIPPDQASKLQTIADGLNIVIAANPRAVFLIEGHTDKVGSDVDNPLDRRAESAATLLDAAVQRADGKPDLAGLWRAVSERGHRRAEHRQPTGHDPQYHAAAQRRIGIAAAPAAGHRAAAALRQVNATTMAGRRIPANSFFILAFRR